MNKYWMGLFFLFLMAGVLFAQDRQTLLLDDFEGSITIGPDGTIEAGTNENATIEIIGDTDIKYSGGQSLKVIFDTGLEGSAWVARGFDLAGVKNAGWLVKPEDIDWDKYAAISFYVYGGDSKNAISLHLMDGGSEVWKYIFIDDFTGWKNIVCYFNDFWVRLDWQPDYAEKNGKIDFPIKSFTFLFVSNEKGTLYIDRAELVGK